MLGFRGSYFFQIFLLFLLGSLFPGAFCRGDPIAISHRKSDISSNYDVIVVGGDPEGIAAAIGAARSGSKTLLVDSRPVPGGLLTRGWLNTWDMNLDPNKIPLNGGLFGEIYGRLEGTAFDLAEMTGFLMKLIANETNLDVIFKAGTVLPNSQGGIIKEVGVFLPGETNLTITGKKFIDATQDADFACAAGAEWRKFGEDVWGEPRNMAVTLVFRLGGISDADWEELRKAARAHGNEAVSGASLRSAWGFGDIIKGYRPSSDRVGVRALNIGRQNDGSVLINALHVFECDGLNIDSRVEARKIAEAELPGLVSFLKRNIPGFSNIKLEGTAPELYVRTSRNVLALYTLTVDDLLENRDFPDRIAFGSYPLDIQATDPGFPGEIIGKPRQYAVPLRCLIPKGITNLLVVGRSAGFSSLAQSSARTIPVGMAAGQGAGISATVSILHDVAFDRLISDPEKIAEIHELMRSQGMNISPNPCRSSSETGHWAYPGLRFLRKHGLASGGYENSYGIDKQMQSLAFINRIVRLQKQLKKVDSRFLYKEFPGNFPLKLRDACRILAAVSGSDEIKNGPFEYFSGIGYFNPPWPENLNGSDAAFSYGCGYFLLGKFFSQF